MRGGVKARCGRVGVRGEAGASKDYTSRTFGRLLHSQIVLPSVRAHCEKRGSL